jgi:SAM-dependent methyltransferase
MTQSHIPNRTGYETGLGHFRAIPSGGGCLDADPSPMVQELIARLRFTAEHVALEGCNVLDYGCGTGLALDWIRSRVRPGRLVGFDVSEGAVAFARQHYAGLEFRLLDIEHPAPDLKSAFDLALSFEVLEHLADPDRAIEHLVLDYLRPDGVLVASTPNRLVFSAGMEPSPINRTHIHEMDLEEFRHLLGQWFAQIEIWGMSFRSQERMAAFARSVESSCDGYRNLGEWWWNPWINRLYRWVWCGGVWQLMTGRQFRHWMAADFEFDSRSPERAIWFFAVARQPQKHRVRRERSAAMPAAARPRLIGG